MVYPRECPIAHLKRMLQLGEVFSGCCRSHWIIVLVKRSIPTDLPPSCFITESGILMFTTITCKSISSFISVVFALCILDLKVLHSICQQIWKTQQWPQDWKRSVFIPIPKKGNAKECSNYHTTELISHASKVMLTPRQPYPSKG